MGSRRVGAGHYLRLDLRSHRNKSLLHILRTLGRCLQKLDAIRIRQRFSLLKCDHLLTLQVTLVPDQQTGDSLRGVFVDLIHPVSHVVETLAVSDVVCDYDPVGATIIGGGDGSETLLTGCVPDLQLYYLGIEVNSPDFLIRPYEIDANG